MEKASTIRPDTSQGRAIWSSRRLTVGIAVAIAIGSTFWAVTTPLHPDPYHVQSWFERLIYPQETNAFLRLPAIDATINDVHIDGETIWAVGSGGLIVHSSDGGRCWQAKGPFAQSVAESICARKGQDWLALTTQFDVSLFPEAHAEDEADKSRTTNVRQVANDPELSKRLLDTANQRNAAEPPTLVDSNQEETPQAQAPGPEQGPSTTKATNDPPAVRIVNFGRIEVSANGRILALGDRGSLARSADFGETWELNPEAWVGLQDISLDQDAAVALGGSGVIQVSEDGGRLWTRANNFNRATLRAVSLQDDIAIAVGRSGVVLRSTDRGRNWTEIRRGGEELLDVHQNGRRVLAVGTNGAILRSEDGGQQWSQVENASDALLYSVYQYGNWSLAVGADGTILRSTDAGVTWVATGSGTRERLRGVAIQQSTAVIVGAGGTVLRSNDNGVNWAPLTAAGNAGLVAVRQQGREALVATRGGRVLRSADSGLTWQPVVQPVVGALAGITFEGLRALAVQTDGQLLVSNDSGNTWQYQEADVSEFDQQVAGLHQFGPRVFTFGDSGLIARSDDSGLSWSRVAPGYQQSIDALSQSNQFALAAGRTGSILRSVDGGQTWSSVRTPTEERLFALDMQAQVAVAAGAQGTLIRSANNGEFWQRARVITGEDLHAVSLHDADGIAVGRNGSILRSTDQGRNWSTAEPLSQANLNAVHLVDQNAVAVGDASTILRSADNGQTWQSIADYDATVPTGWYVLLVLALGMFVYALRPEKQQELEGILGAAVSDRPLEPGQSDVLNLGETAQAISRFVRNPNTTAPFTFAIAGQWGSGKSSLMNLLFNDLVDRGYAPVWFNAWHHQKGEQLLATLFAHIREQAIPPLVTVSGLWFRLKLLHRRARRHWLVFSFWALALFVALALGGPVLEDALAKLEQILAGERILLDTGGLDPVVNGLLTENWLQVLASLFGIGGPLAALLHYMQGFGLNPARLVSHSSDGARKRFDPGARARFAREFEDVTKSLGADKMVIFIDDLDRCTRENLVDILENVNFLATSGECFIVLGMAPTYVRAVIADAHEQLAQTIASERDHDNGEEQSPVVEKFRFADHYLEKMISIQINIPVLSDDATLQMLAAPEQTVEAPLDTRLDRAARKIREVLIKPVFIVFCALVGLAVGMRIDLAPPARELVEVTEPWPVSEQDLVAISQGLSLETDADIGDSTEDLELVIRGEPGVLDRGLVVGTLGAESGGHAELVLRRYLPSDPVVGSGDSNSLTDDQANGTDADNDQTVASIAPGTNSSEGRLPIFSMGVWLLVTALIAFSFHRRGQHRYAKDSEDFKQALASWSSFIHLRAETPRKVKQFMNELRYYATLFSEEIPEPALVALAAIRFANPAWLSKLGELNSTGLPSLFKESFGQQSNNALAERIGTGVDEFDAWYKERAGQEGWQPWETYRDRVQALFAANR